MQKAQAEMGCGLVDIDPTIPGSTLPTDFQAYIHAIRDSLPPLPAVRDSLLQVEGPAKAPLRLRPVFMCAIAIRATAATANVQAEQQLGAAGPLSRLLAPTWPRA